MKKRTENKFINAVIAGIRTAFKRYSPNYEQVLLRSRKEYDKYNKDNSLSKKKMVLYTCEICNNEFSSKEIEVDHIQPVIDIDKTRSDYTIQEIFDRINCDISNLQLICKKCHEDKTKKEKQDRKDQKRKGKK